MESTIQLPDPDNTTYLIDASIYIFRAWFGIPDHFFDDLGRPVNAVYGYSTFLRKFLQLAKPQKVVAAFDESLETGFRHQLYSDYKANRALPDDSLAHQLACCKGITEQLGISTAASSVYEADDLIAAIAKKRRAKGETIVVLTADKDLAQMVYPGDYLWDFTKGTLWSYEQLSQHWGFPLGRVADYLAIVGDSVDCIPGVQGIGPKIGKQLMAHFDSIEALYTQLDDVLDLPLRGAKGIWQRLQDNEEDVRLYKQLTLLQESAKCSASDKAVKLVGFRQKKFDQWLTDNNLAKVIRWRL